MPTTTNKIPLKIPTVLRGVKIPTGDEVYDSIMRKIEPELLTKNLKKLDTPYREETAPERTKRYQRYSMAFVEYKKIYQAWAERLGEAMKSYKRALHRTAETLSGTGEQNILESLVEQIQAA